jgi:hypothetical protein
MTLQSYRINYEQVMQDGNLPTTIKLLAARLLMNPHMLVGNFYANLSDNELEELRELIDDPDAAASELLLLTLMLSAAEGAVAISEEELESQMRATMIFISTSGLHRKGMVTAHFESFSYGEDMIDSNLATPTQMGLDYIKQLRGDNEY